MNRELRDAMVPLFAREADGTLPPALEAAEQRLRPFFEAGVLGPAELHVAARLGQLGGATEGDLLLALALAVRAPLHGHICVDLRRLDHSLLPELDRLGLPNHGRRLDWPADAAAWREALGRCEVLVRSGKSSEGGQQRATPFVLDGWRLYTDRYWRYQQRLAAELRRRSAADSLAPADPGLLRQGLVRLFSPATGPLDRQLLAAAMALLRPLAVISGGPGMGKTWTIRNILVLTVVQWAAARQQDPSLPRIKVALAAPTGKAAARMKEAINHELEQYLIRLDQRVLGSLVRCEHIQGFMEQLEPCTLHRLLEYQVRTPSRFRHHAGDPLRHHLVVVDEASMVDFALMAKLVDAVPPDSRLILLGDRHQLASVEAGSVLADLCGESEGGRPSVSARLAGELQRYCGLELRPEEVRQIEQRTLHDSIVQLNKNYRFSAASGIGAFARACLEPAARFDAGRAAALLSSGAAEADTCLLPHGRDGLLSARVQQLVTEAYEPYLRCLLGGPRPNEPEPQFHRRVLAELDRFRVLCAHRRGRLGVAGLNAAVEQLLAAALPGFDPSEDNYPGRPVLIRRNDYTVERFNGDVGVMVQRSVRGDQPSLQVAFPGKGHSDVDYLAPSRLPPHQTVFAMTIHKSQGSQFGHAMIVLPTRPSPILTRELVYTGVTRAARRMTLVGDPQVLQGALARTVQRASGLQQELWNTIKQEISNGVEP